MTQQLFHKAIQAFDRVNEVSETVHGRPMVNRNAMLTYIKYVLDQDDEEAMHRFISTMETWADALSTNDNL
jgi:hypothetical protein